MSYISLLDSGMPRSAQHALTLGPLPTPPAVAQPRQTPLATVPTPVHPLDTGGVTGLGGGSSLPAPPTLAPSRTIESPAPTSPSAPPPPPVVSGTVGKTLGSILPSVPATSDGLMGQNGLLAQLAKLNLNPTYDPQTNSIAVSAPGGSGKIWMQPNGTWGWSANDQASVQAPPPTSPSTSGPTNGDWQSWFMGLVGGRPSSYGLIEQLAPQLNAAGVQVHYNLEGQPSKLILPNGHYISVVDANGAWRWEDQGTATSPSPSAAPAATTLPFGMASGASWAPGSVLPTPPAGMGPAPTGIDPITGLPVNVAASYPGPQFSDPGTQTLEQLVTSYIQQLTQGVNDPAQASLAQMTADRIKTLQGAPFTDQQSQQILAAATNQIEADRQAALQAVQEHLGAMGYSGSSGPMAQALLQTNQYYDQLRTQAESQVSLHAIDQASTNQNQALALQQMLTQLSAQNRSESSSRAMSAIQLASLLADLPAERLQLAEQAAGSGASPQSVFSMASQLAGAKQQSNLTGAAAESNLLSQLGQLIGAGTKAGTSLIPGLGGGGGSDTTDTTDASTIAQPLAPDPAQLQQLLGTSFSTAGLSNNPLTSATGM